MNTPVKKLVFICIGSLLLSVLLYLFTNVYKGDHYFSVFNYIVVLVACIVLVLLPTFIFGFISWTIFKKTKPNIVSHFIVFSLVGLAVILMFYFKITYSIWHYNNYRSNIDYNESLTKNGGYLDTCMMMVQNDIKSKGSLPNDYRILSYNINEALETVPRDTTHKYYEFGVYYSKVLNNNKTVRAASYLINFDKKIILVYDVDSRNIKAKEQNESMKKDLRNLKEVLDKNPDSSYYYIKNLRDKLKAAN